MLTQHRVSNEISGALGQISFLEIKTTNVRINEQVVQREFEILHAVAYSDLTGAFMGSLVR